MSNDTQNQLLLRQPDVSLVEAQVPSILADAGAIVVDSMEAHEEALRIDQRAATGLRLMKEALDPFCADLHAAHKAACARRDKYLAPFAQARALIQPKVFAWEDRARRLAEEERARLQAGARKAEEDRALADAMAADAAGDHDLASQILDEPIQVPRVQVAPPVAHVAGSSTRTTWHAEVVDLKALIKYVATHDEWIPLLAPVMSNLDGLARSQKERLAIPGVRAFSKRGLSSRSS